MVVENLGAYARISPFKKLSKNNTYSKKSTLPMLFLCVLVSLVTKKTHKMHIQYKHPDGGGGVYEQEGGEGYR